MSATGRFLPLGDNLLDVRTVLVSCHPPSVGDKPLSTNETQRV
jgi:hypothetical protein